MDGETVSQHLAADDTLLPESACAQYEYPYSFSTLCPLDRKLPGISVRMNVVYRKAFELL
jgi:hypothetical protein